MKRKVLVLATLLATLCIALVVHTAWAKGNDKQTPQQKQQHIIELLDKVRKNPSLKPTVLEKMRTKMQKRKLTNIDNRIASVSKTFDQAATMNDGTYQQQKMTLVGQIQAQFRDASKKGGGTKPKPSGAPAH